MFLAMKTEGGFRQMLALHLNFLLTELSISRRNRFNFKWKALQAKADCYLQKENILSFNYFLVFTQPCTSRAVRRAGWGNDTGPPRSGKTDTPGVSTLCPSEVMTHSKKLVVTQTHPQEKSS